MSISLLFAVLKQKKCLLRIKPYKPKTRLLKEVDGLIKETVIGVVRDAGIIAAEQKVKHYEIATYGTLYAFAKTLEENKAVNLLAMILDEKKKKGCNFNWNCNVNYQQTSLQSRYNHKYQSLIPI